MIEKMECPSGWVNALELVKKPKKIHLNGKEKESF